ncbi:hypothetical protein SAMN06265376_103380 [Dokdonia pacifica]|uniref:Uncharacterized protein n=1 Tax=Dokdonia pacifica TaxID=1627892 RepID=A0A238ZN69_9FLAO|nr:hypothetical protein SAMN06265376_103380 [Dokdonia pacifica]
MKIVNTKQCIPIISVLYFNNSAHKINTSGGILQNLVTNIFFKRLLSINQ